MPVLKYKDPADGLWKPVPVGAGGNAPDEVVVATVEPTNPQTEYWIDPTGTPAGGSGADYLPLAGGTVTGNLQVDGDTIAQWVSAGLGASMNGNRITQVADPVEPDDAANRQWVESRNPPMIVLGATDEVPPDTLSGTVIVRTL